MDLTDASLVLLAEESGEGRIVGTDERDFHTDRWKNQHPFRNLLLGQVIEMDTVLLYGWEDAGCWIARLDRRARCVSWFLVMWRSPWELTTKLTWWPGPASRPG
ncbi:MAG: putative nucleic acid-binding protein [Candidatus Accumulibacter vicinus]|uniref:Putative nucleic acid-binding protein n=1 Tax=Candidatus Accumulibacter vicinus TaxID=2954382 RepID=A0A084Y489_9PROT|nr:MAG: putative nucleic acid-binding protein [Candidatus Accumulibacter vicinus]